MRRTISAMLCGCLISTATAFAEADQILLQFSGQGTQMSGLFTAKDNWEVRWKSDKGLSIFTFDQEGNRIASIAHAEHAGGGSAHQENAGTYSLKIMTDGTWTVTVVQRK